MAHARLQLLAALSEVACAELLVSGFALFDQREAFIPCSESKFVTAHENRCDSVAAAVSCNCRGRPQLLS